MNKNEMRFFTKKELEQFDITTLKFSYILKSLIVKIFRRIFGFFSKENRFVWMVNEVSDVSGPEDNVRNYLERRTIRKILNDITLQKIFENACEIGCGYGRLTMVLKEFSKRVVGFERESHFVQIAKDLNPELEFVNCSSLDKLETLNKGKFDFIMTCTVLQHLTDDFARSVCNEIKQIASDNAYVLIIEKTEAISVTKNQGDGNSFLSRARSIQTYENFMKPYVLVNTTERKLEPTYFNKSPGMCMLFRK